MPKLTRSILFSCLFWGLLANAQTSEPSSLAATFHPGTITLDGLLEEDVWDSAVHITNFTQRELNFGQSVTERTEVAIVYSKENMYIGVWCYDSDPENIIAKEMKRDFSYHLDDNFIVIFDTYRDKRNGFMFVTNPNGARADYQIFNNGSSVNSSWNGVWDVRTTRTSSGWFAEIKIPLYTLKYREKDESQIWGVNFERNIRRKREQARWQGYSRDNTIEQVNRCGSLMGLDSLRNKPFVEFKPYGIGGISTENGKQTTVANAGGDVNYLLSPTYRLNVTFNTDFAQVESDQQQINLTRFPLYFPELREFFLEGNDYFDMGFGGNRIIPFYTRKIGLNDNREAVPIIAGARLLGKEKNRTVGLMSIQTADKDGESGANFSTLSWRQDVGKQSVIGAMSTNKITEGNWHSTTGVNGRYSLSTFRGKRNLDIGGAFIQTYNSDTSFVPNAFAYRFYVYYPNDRWFVIASTQRSPANFNPEVGLLRRANFMETFGMFVYKPRPKKRLRFIRQYDIRPAVVTYVQYDDTKAMQSFEYQVRYLGFETRSGENVLFDYKRIGEGLQNDFEIVEGVIIPKGRYWWNQWEGYFSTFAGRSLSMVTYWVWGDFFDGKSVQANQSVNWRIGKHLSLNSTYQRNDVRLDSGSFTTNLWISRLDYALNPRAFGSVVGQWNNANDQMIMNYRLQIIPKIGADFFLIVNQVVDVSSGKYDVQRSTILGKLIWRLTT